MYTEFHNLNKEYILQKNMEALMGQKSDNFY